MSFGRFISIVLRNFGITQLPGSIQCDCRYNWKIAPGEYAANVFSSKRNIPTISWGGSRQNLANWSLEVVDLQRRDTKCTQVHNASVDPLLRSIGLLIDVILSAVLFCLSSLIFFNKRTINQALLKSWPNPNILQRNREQSFNMSKSTGTRKVLAEVAHTILILPETVWRKQPGHEFFSYFSHVQNNL